MNNAQKIRAAKIVNIYVGFLDQDVAITKTEALRIANENKLLEVVFYAETTNEYAEARLVNVTRPSEY